MIGHWTLRLANSTNITLANAEVTDLELPKIVREFDSDRRVGYAGAVPIPIGYGELELTFTTTTVTNDWRTLLASLGRINFIFTGLEQKNDGTFVTTTVVCNGYVEENPLGTFATDKAEFEVTAKINSVELNVDGTQVLKFSPETYEYIVNGVNQFLEVRNSLGI